jgi:MFS family permease
MSRWCHGLGSAPQYGLPVASTVRPDSGDGVDNRLLLAISIVVFVDTMFYAVLAPLLPGLVRELHLSKASAGLLTASYPLGTLVGSIPGGVLAARAGPRTTVCTGLFLLMVSTIAFGCVDNVVALDIARFIEGIGGACSWAGGLAWIVDDAPANRRGALIGKALGAAIAGALLGPVIGTVATATGRTASFCVLAAGVGGLLLWASRRPSSHHSSGQGWSSVRAALVRPDVISGMWLVALPAVASGLLNVLGPLRLHGAGVAAGGVGAAFLAAATLEAALAPLVGELSDRRGRLLPLRAGLLAASVVLLCFTLPRNPFLIAVMVVLLAAALGLFWAPAMAMLSDIAETQGLDQGLAAALMNLAWAGGQILGSGGGGSIAKAAGDSVPMATVAGLCGITLVALTFVPKLQAYTRTSTAQPQHG